jgi:tetratricopeptide (TPR) repeat protein
MLLLLLSISFQCSSESTDQVIKADQQYKFASYLVAQRDYFRAITEIKRFKFLYPDDIRAKESDFLIADCYYKAGKWENALAELSVIENSASGRKQNLCKLKKAHCLIELKTPDKAIEVLSSLISPSITTGHDVNVYALMLCTLATARLKDMDKTVKYLNLMAEFKDDVTAVTFASSSLSNIAVYLSSPKKSPLLATALSTVIPGTGQIYAGRTSDGLVAAGSIIVFAAMSINANTSNHHAERNFLYFFNASQYISNIYGANRAARQYNSGKKNAVLNQINDNILGTLNNLPIFEEIPCD